METTGKCKILNRDIIKYFAMLTMLLNHIATIFLKTGTPLCEIFTAIGYFTAIVMIYFLVEGYYYTRSKKRYLLRLFVFALISEIPYCLALTEDSVIGFYGLNMFFTLCICFGIIWAVENVKNKFLLVCLVILGILCSVLCSWALLAPVYTLLFLWARKSGKRIGFAFLIASLIFGIFSFLGGIGNFPVFTNVLYAVLAMAGMGLAGVCIVFFYNGKRMEVGKNFSKWFFYLFYPSHLLILGVIRILQIV